MHKTYLCQTMQYSNFDFEALSIAVKTTAPQKPHGNNAQHIGGLEAADYKPKLLRSTSLINSNFNYLQIREEKQLETLVVLDWVSCFWGTSTKSYQASTLSELMFSGIEEFSRVRQITYGNVWNQFYVVYLCTCLRFLKRI